MKYGEAPDAIHTGLVFRIYGVVLTVAGFVIASWAPIWFPGRALGDYAWIRTAGACMMAAGCFTFPLAGADDAAARKRGLLWYAAGHLFAFLLIGAQHIAIWETVYSRTAVHLLFGSAFLFTYLYATADGEFSRSTVVALFAPPDASRPLHLQYESSIRQAAAQEERNRLARDLHDSIRQQLFAVQTSAATAEARFEIDPAGARDAVAQVRAAARDALAEMEALVQQLHSAPLSDDGLMDAIRKQCEAVELRTGAEVTFHADRLPPATAFAPGLPNTLFRIVQESLSNAARHARASQVKVSLTAASGVLRLMVSDNGAGFDVAAAQRGMGLSNIHARARELRGTAEVRSRAGEGTTVEVAVPYLQYDPKQYRQTAWTSAFLLVVSVGVGIRGNNATAVALAALGAIMMIRYAVASHEGAGLIRIALADDHKVVTRSLRAYLEPFPEFTVVGAAATGEELLAHLNEWQPDIVLQDLLLPGGIDGIETTRRILRRCPGVRVIALTASTDQARADGVKHAGAAGYVRKDAEPEILLQAVRAVAQGHTWFPRATPVAEVLTERECDVLHAIAQGLSNKDIAQALTIGEETVKTHVSHVLSKLGADNRAKAVVQGIRRGLIQLNE